MGAGGTLVQSANGAWEEKVTDEPGISFPFHQNEAARIGDALCAMKSGQQAWVARSCPDPTRYEIILEKRQLATT